LNDSSLPLITSEPPVPANRIVTGSRPDVRFQPSLL
jgi:hypothetical protein